MKTETAGACPKCGSLETIKVAINRMEVLASVPCDCSRTDQGFCKDCLAVFWIKE